MDSHVLVADTYLDSLFTPFDRQTGLKHISCASSYMFDPLFQQAEDLACELDFNETPYILADTNEESLTSGSDEEEDMRETNIDCWHNGIKRENVVDSISQQNDQKQERASSSSNSNINFNNFNLSVNLFNAVPQLDDSVDFSGSKPASSQFPPAIVSPNFNSLSLPNYNFSMSDFLSGPLYDNFNSLPLGYSSNNNNNFNALAQLHLQQKLKQLEQEQAFISSALFNKTKSEANNGLNFASNLFPSKEENKTETASVYSNSDSSSHGSKSTGKTSKKRQRETKSARAELNDFIPGKPQSKKAKKQALAKSTPGFMIKEIEQARGTGEFTSAELAITLFYAHKYFMDSNAYSKVRSCLNFTRSRASIRRKIEKIVAQEIGVTGGLLLTDSMRHKCKDILHLKLAKLIEEMSKSADDSEKNFAVNMANLQASEKDS